MKLGDRGKWGAEAGEEVETETSERQEGKQNREWGWVCGYRRAGRG